MRSFILLWVFLFSPASFSAPTYRLQSLNEAFRDPTFVTVAPGRPGKLYLVEQAGRILELNENGLKIRDFLDIRDKVLSGGEMGLLSVAFHPKFAENGRYFIYYTADRKTRINIVAERKEGSDVETELFNVAQPYSNHNGGQLLFGPDGFLYIGKGDGGSANDPHGNGQNKYVLLAKILRIDVDRKDEAHHLAYGIPNDNPFAGGGGSPEIFAYGLRNPWRFSFDKKTGQLWVGDVGQDLWEEIDIVERGKNYGWNVWEGNHCFKPKKNCPKPGFEPAIFDYGRKEGQSITGGHVYHGKNLGELEGAYIYGDYGSGKIWALFYDAQAKKVVENRLLLDLGTPTSSFGLDEQGEILVVGYNGILFRLTK